MTHKFDLISQGGQLGQSFSFQQAQQLKQELQWKQLAEISVGESIEYWLNSLNPHTARSYSTSLKQLNRMGFLDLQGSLQGFSLVNHEQVVDEIKLIPHWSEATKQARAAAYISLTSFLQRRTQGMIHKALSNREGVAKTFYKVRDKVKTNPLNPEQTKLFIKALEQINRRDALIAKLMLQGGKRKGEVLSLETSTIDFQRSQIRFVQSKTKGIEKQTIITYPVHVMNELKEYINGRQGLCFVTRNGKPLADFQIDRNFQKAGELAGIPFRISPHVLRVTLVTRLKEMKIQDSEIMKITGHASTQQLLSYDRSELADNPSAQISLV